MTHSKVLDVWSPIGRPPLDRGQQAVAQAGVHGPLG